MKVVFFMFCMLTQCLFVVSFAGSPGGWWRKPFVFGWREAFEDSCWHTFHTHHHLFRSWITWTFLGLTRTALLHPPGCCKTVWKKRVSSQLCDGPERIGESLASMRGYVRSFFRMLSNCEPKSKLGKSKSMTRKIHQKFRSMFFLWCFKHFFCTPKKVGTRIKVRSWPSSNLDQTWKPILLVVDFGHPHVPMSIWIGWCRW